VSKLVTKLYIRNKKSIKDRIYIVLIRLLAWDKRRILMLLHLGEMCRLS